MKNVAFFFSAISTQKLKKQREKKKSNDHDENEESDKRAVNQAVKT